MHGFWSNPVALQELYFCWLLAKNVYFYRCFSVVAVVVVLCVCAFCYLVFRSPVTYHI